MKHELQPSSSSLSSSPSSLEEVTTICKICRSPHHLWRVQASNLASELASAKLSSLRKTSLRRFRVKSSQLVLIMLTLLLGVLNKQLVLVVQRQSSAVGILTSNDLSLGASVTSASPGPAAKPNHPRSKNKCID